MRLPLGLAIHSEENLEDCDPAVRKGLLNAIAFRTWGWYVLRRKLLMFY